MERDAGAALKAGSPALDTRALMDGGVRVLDAGALGNTAEVLNRSDAGVVQPRLDDPLTADEKRFVEEQLSLSETVTDRVVELIEQVAQRRGVALGPLRLISYEVLTEPEPEATLAQFGGSAADWQALTLGVEIAEIAKELSAEIDREWNDLGSPARLAFEDAAKVNGKKPELWYRKIRAMMCAEGWPDPARYWNDIVDGELVGVPIQNGVHRKLLDKLKAETDQAPGDLTAKLPGGQPAPIRGVIGFQPRPVAGTEKLSNHAWGLAIDVDAQWNPYITDKEVIRIVKEHTSEHVDLSKDPLNVSVPDEQKLATRYEILKKASDDLVAWLQGATRKEEQLATAVQQAENALRDAYDSKDARAIKQAEDGVKAARDAYDKDADVRDLTSLRQRLGAKDFASWKDTGILALPLEFVKKIKSKGLGWGGEYDKKKDFMHFELNPVGVLERADQ